MDNTDSFNVDKLLKKISKTQDINEISDLIFGGKLLTSNLRIEILSLYILRALTDKGFKSVASMCSQEYFNNEDLDGDGKIYGVDFIFRNPPPILANMQLEKTKWNDDQVLDWVEFKKERLG